MTRPLTADQAPAGWLPLAGKAIGAGAPAKNLPVFFFFFYLGLVMEIPRGFTYQTGPRLGVYAGACPTRAPRR